MSASKFCYQLRGIDLKLWSQVKARAESEGHTVRYVILALLSRYLAKGLK